jgi:methionine sulfoxide reductase heme-binding subunit
VWHRTFVSRIALCLAASLLGGLIVFTLAARLGLTAVPLSRPDTHWFWYFSRATGVTAYLALAMATVWGLLVSSGMVDWLVARGRSVELHKWLSSVSLVLVVGHGAALIEDSYVRFDALDVLVPFLAPYRPVAVGLGIVGLYLALVVYGSFAVRTRLGMRRWRALHALSFPAFALVTLHGVLAGSDSGLSLVRLMYIVSAGLVLWLTLYRGLIAMVARRIIERPAQLA